MRALRCLLSVVVGVVCLLVVGGGVALALPVSFGNGEGDGSGQFNGATGIAVEQESGDVYVADSQNERVDKFGPSGEFLFAWGWGVADGHTETLQTCTTGCFAGVAGGGAGELSGPRGVAVDNDPLSASYRDVYVVDTANSRVEKFDSAGNFVLMFGGGVNETTSGDVCLAGEACRAGTGGSEPGEFERLGEGGGIAVDAAGNVFVGDVNRVQEFGPGGVLVGHISIPGAGAIGAVAVDSSGDVYVGMGASGGGELSGVRKYEGCAGSCVGVELGEPRDAAGEFAYSAGGFIALGTSGEVFIGDGGPERSDHIREYDPSGIEVASFDANTEGNENGIAFSGGIGGLYVLGQGKVRVVGLPPAGPLVVSVTATELQPTTVGVNAAVNPEGHETSYHVEYGTSASYGSSTPAASLGGTFEDESVSAGLSGLQPRTTYHFRIVATNSAGTAFGEDESFTTLPPVLIDSESVSGVTATSATLAGQLNPLGRDTTYRFEYGTSTAYGSSVPAPDGDIGSGTSDVPLSALVEGLSPGTVYHYRIVASNSLGTVDGPDRVFTTLSGEASVLPDGRAWEMVSPPEKRGFALEPISNAPSAVDIQAAANGSAITYGASGPIDADPQGNRSIVPSQILSTRAADGWSSLDITPRHETVNGRIHATEYQVFSPDLSVGLIEQSSFTPLAPQATERTPYRREAGGEYQPLVTAANVPPGTQFGKLGEGLSVSGDVEFMGASSDLSHVVVASSPSLTVGVANPNPGNENLFEWVGGSLRLVSVLPNEKAATEEEANASLGHIALGGGVTRHAVSDDGSRVFWAAAGVGGSRLYVRDMGRGETVQVDAAEAGAHGQGGGGLFDVASSDGSKVFFTDKSRLTRDANARGNDLYMCAVGVTGGKLTCRLKDLSVDLNLAEEADVLGTVIGASEDGRYVYFVANGVLAAGATPGNCAQEGGGEACNLYVYDTVQDTVRFVAQLAASDFQSWEANVNRSELDLLTAGVSPDGRYLAFMSGRSLTGYDNIDVRSGQPDVEVYLYDAGTNRLLCASCDPSGARPSGVFDFGGGGAGELLVDRIGAWSGQWLAGSIPGWTNSHEYFAYYRSRYLSDSGRLFFNSPDSLVGRDTNGKEDVYEYEPAGVGGCASATGCVGLISSGTSSEESAFIDASESGDDAFFLTTAQLAPADVDGSLDVYDARVCSAGSPCLASPPVSPGPCVTADSCRAAASPQPGVFGAPPSATFSGAGNIVQAPSKAVARKKTVSLAQRRAAALRKCRMRPRRRRAACEALVRKRYRVGVKAKRSRAGFTTKKGSR